MAWTDFCISTHAPRTGSDGTAARGGGGFRRFQPTLPARGATCNFNWRESRCGFQPTLPARGATPHARHDGNADGHFNPRSPHGERPSQNSFWSPRCDFNPRSPHGERLAQRLHGRVAGDISTHAPRTGSDYFVALRG